LKIASTCAQKRIEALRFSGLASDCFQDKLL